MLHQGSFSQLRAILLLDLNKSLHNPLIIESPTMIVPSFDEGPLLFFSSEGLFLFLPAWYKWRVEFAIASDWRKVRGAAKESRPTEGQELLPNLLLVRGSRTGTSTNRIRNQR